MLRTPFIVLLVNALLWMIQAQLNHYISPWNISIFVGGLAVAFCSLRLSYREGLRALLLTGLWFDAATPVPFGLHAFLFLLCQALVFTFRSRLAREETMVGMIIAAATNLGMMFAMAIGLMHRSPAPLQQLPRLIADSLVSFCVVMLIAGWSFKLQEQTLEIAGVSLRREQRGVV
ncbi:MAG TPA: hypothetical protein VFT72_20370 [Opitutaceae bacterium]|nr:hypothetical protein [Opitutaceae bacterium]